MESNTSQQPGHLLESSLDILHFETRDWIRDLEFWKDELSFFHHLMDNPLFTGHENGPDYERLREQLLAQKGHLQNDLLPYTRQHETQLSVILRNKQNVDENTYRESHRALQQRVTAFDNEMRELKKRIFLFEKNAG